MPKFLNDFKKIGDFYVFLKWMAYKPDIVFSSELLLKKKNEGAGSESPTGGHEFLSLICSEELAEGLFAGYYHCLVQKMA